MRLWDRDDVVAGTVVLTGWLDVDSLGADLARAASGLGLPAPRLPMTDLSGLSPARAAEQAEMVARQELERDMDTALRARLVRLTPTRHELTLVAGKAVPLTALLTDISTHPSSHPLSA